MGHLLTWKTVSMQYTSLSKAMIITVHWIELKWCKSTINWTNLNPLWQKYFVKWKVEICTVVLEKKYSKVVIYFHYVATNVSFLGNSVAAPFFNNLNSLYSRMLSDKFGWNWPNGSGERKTRTWPSLIFNLYVSTICTRTWSVPKYHPKVHF